MSPRLVLVLCGLAFLGFGVAFLGWPVRLAAAVDLMPMSASAVTEIRAMYGGLEIGLGLFLLAAAAREAHHRLALGLAMCAFGGLAAGRAVGLLAGGEWQPLMLRLLAAEIVAAAAAALAWRRTSVR